MAGPNVGHIEVTVDASTNRLKAQLTAAGKEGGAAAKQAAENELKDLNAVIDFQTQDVKAQAKSLRKQIEIALRSDVDLGLDTFSLKRELNLLEQQIEAMDAAINVYVSDRDLAEINARIKALSAEMRLDVSERDIARVNAQITAMVDKNREVSIQFEADLAAINTQIAAFRKRQELDAVNLRIEGDLDTLNASVEKFLHEQRHFRVGVDMDPDIAGANARLAIWRKEQEANAVNVPVDVDTSSLAGGGRGLSTRWKAIIGSLVALAEPLAVLLAGSLAGATSVLSSAMLGLGASMGAVVPLFAGLAAVVGTAIVGFRGLGDAIGGNADAMRDLAPEARKFAEAFRDLVPAFSRLRDEVQGRLFSELSDEMSAFGDQLPALTDGLGAVADELNDFFRDLLQLANEADLEGIFAGLTPVIDSVLDTILSLASAVEPFLLAAAPAARRLAEGFAAAAESLADLIAAGADSGGINDFLQRGLDSMKLWVDLLGSIGDALFTVFEAGQASGDGFVSSLTDIIDRFDSWAESLEGQEALAAFFDSGREALGALTPILQGLQGLFEELVTPEAVDRFVELSEQIGRILPALGTLLALVGQSGVVQFFGEAIATIADAVTAAAPALEELAGWANVVFDALDFLGPTVIAVGVAFLTWYKAAKAIKAVQLALAGMTKMHPVLLAIGAAVGLAVTAFDLFGSSGDDVSAAAGDLAKALAEETDAMILSGEAANNAALGHLALSRALLSTSLGGVEDDLGTLGVTADKTAETMIALGRDTSDALTQLGINAGLTGEQARELAENIDSVEKASTAQTNALVVLGGETALTDSELEQLATTLFNVAEAGRSLDLDETQRQFIGLFGSASEANMALVEQAEKLSGVSRFAKDVSPVYDELNRLIAENATTLDEDAAAAEAVAIVFATLAVAVADVGDESSAAVGSLNGFQTALGLQRQFADEARQALDDLQAELLEQAGSAFDAEEAALAVAKSVDNLRVKTDEYTKAVADGTLKGEDQAQALRDLRSEEISAAESVFAAAEAFAEQEMAQGNSASKADLLRWSLAQQREQYPGLRDEIDTYIGELDKVPPDVTTEAKVTGVGAALAELHELNTTVQALDGQVVEIFGKFTPLGSQQFAEGGRVGPGGGIAGEAGTELLARNGRFALTTGPMLVSPGTLVTPLDKMGSFGPSGAAMRSLIDQLGKPNDKPAVVNNLYITTTTDDPEAVATQILNRAAALANR